jgi:hypothetical protein
VEVIHFCLVRIELNPNLGPPSGEVGEESFQFRIIFDNDGNIVNINECVRVLGDQTLDQQLIYNSEQERGAGASFFDAPRGLEVYPFSLYVRVCVSMCIDRAEGVHIVRREPGMVQDGENGFMDCGREGFGNIQQNHKRLPALHFVLVEGVD